MLKDLFFNIWFDDFGSGWMLFVIVLFLFLLSFLIFNIALIKAKNTKFSKKHLISLGLIILFIYQIIPVSIDFIANLVSPFNIKRAIQIEQVAIKTSIISWQKGGYYCKLAALYLIDKNYNKMYETYDSAYKYLKNYNNPCWGISYLSFYTKGDYDKAIEIAKNWKAGKTPYHFISNCFLMKGDTKNAELYINKAIEQKETYLNLALKAYILKITDNQTESLKYYKRAIDKCKNDKEKNMVTKTYANFVKNETDRLNILRKQQNLK